MYNIDSTKEYKLNIRKNMFYSLLIPYLIIGTTLIIVFILSFKIVYDKLKDEYLKNSVVVLNEIKRDMNEVTINTSRLVVDINNNARINRLNNITSTDMTNEQHYNIAMAVRELSNFNIYNQNIQNIHIYYPSIELSLVIRSLSNLDLLYHNYDFQETASYNEFLDFVNSYHMHSEIVGIGNKLFYVTSSNIDNKSHKNTFIQLNRENLLGKFQGYTSLNKGKLIITDINKNNIYLSTDYEGVINQEIIQRLNDTSSLENGLLEQKDLFIQYQDDEKLGISYIWITHKADVIGNQKGLILSFFFIAFTFIILLLVGIISVSKNYSYVSDIIEQLKKNQDVGKPKKMKYSDIAFIKESIIQLENCMAEQENVILEENIKKAMFGLIEKDDNRYFWIKNKCPELFCGITMLSIFEDEENEKKSAFDRNLNIFCLDNIIKEKMTDAINFIIPVYGWLIVITNCKDNSCEGMDNILEILDFVRNYFNKNFNINYTVGVSMPVEGILDYTKAYRQAIEALQNKHNVGRNSLIYYGNIEEYEKRYFLDDLTKKKLLNYIQVRDEDNAVALIHEIYESNFVHSKITVECEKIILLDLCQTVIKGLQIIHRDINLELETIFDDKYYPLDVINKIVSGIRRICVDYKDTNTTMYKMEQVKEYILENYKNSDLTVSTISEYFSLNNSYLSRTFKECLGDNLLSYITTCRLEYAKIVLRESSYNLEQIALESGFQNATILTRAFKKYEGMTPSKYREMN